MLTTTIKTTYLRILAVLGFAGLVEIRKFSDFTRVLALLVGLTLLQFTFTAISVELAAMLPPESSHALLVAGSMASVFAAFILVACSILVPAHFLLTTRPQGERNFFIALLSQATKFSSALAHTETKPPSVFS